MIKALFRTCVFIMCLLSLPALTRADVQLVDQGKVHANIVVAADAPMETQRAAKSLADFIEKISGVRPQVTQNPADQGASIFVGPHPALAARFPGLSLEFDKPEQILIACNDTNVAILGRDRMIGETQVEHGSANAVYTFIQDQLGVRFLWPGEYGTDVIQHETITIPTMEFRYAPQFRQRAMNKYRIQYSSKEEEFRDWHRFQRNELHSLQMSSGHSFSSWGAKYFKEHPEYFAMAPDGIRGFMYKPGRLQVCVTNPGLQESWLESAKEMMAARPGQVLSATAVDGTRTGQCMCDACKAWDNPNGVKTELVWGSATGKWTKMDYVSLTDRYVKFWNTLARQLKQRYPDKDLYVGGMAYGVYSAPPVDTKVDDNVVIAYVGRMIVASEEARAASHEEWLKWAEKANNLTFRPNLFWYTGGMIGMPTVSTRTTIEDYRFLAEHNCRGIVFDSWPGFFATQGPQLYLMMQLAWNPTQDGEALLNDYYTRAFGPAAKPIRQYFQLMEDIHMEISQQVRYNSGAGATEAPALFAKLYTPQRMQQAAVYLATAQSLTPKDSIHRHRVDYVKLGLDFVNLNLDMIRTMAKVRETKGRSQDAVQKAIRLHAQREKMLADDTSGFALGGKRFNQTRTSRRMLDVIGPPTDKYLKDGGMDDE